MLLFVSVRRAFLAFVQNNKSKNHSSLNCNVHEVESHDAMGWLGGDFDASAMELDEKLPLLEAAKNKKLVTTFFYLLFLSRISNDGNWANSQMLHLPLHMSSGADADCFSYPLIVNPKCSFLLSVMVTNRRVVFNFHDHHACQMV